MDLSALRLWCFWLAAYLRDRDLDVLRYLVAENPIGKHAALASTAQLTHEVSAVVLGTALVTHWPVILRHHRAHKDRYVHRILPLTHQR